MRRAWRWLVAAGGGVLLTAVHVASERPLVREGAWTVLVAAATAGVVAGVRHHRPRTPGPWYVLAAGFVLLTVANVANLPLWSPAGPARTAMVVLELGAFPLMGAAAYGMVRLQSPEGDRDGAVDAGIVLVALATAMSGTVVADRLLDAPSLFDRLLVVVAPLVLAGVTTVALRLLFFGGRGPSTYLLVGAATSALVGHVLRTYSQTAGTYTRGSWEDAFIAAAYAGVAFAALHPSMLDLTRPHPPPGGRLTVARLTLLGVSLLTPPVAMLLQRRASLVPLAASAVVSTLVLVRLWCLVLDREGVRDELRRQALHDALTGLPNRPAVLRGLEDALRTREPPGTATATIFIDLDGFKQINDDFGHRAGDDTLVAVARRLREVCRAEDLVGRLSGDEFVVVCADVEESDVAVIAERVLAAFATPFSLPAADVTLGASIGVAVRSADGGSPGQLLSEADAAMYRAKQRGGRSVERYDDELGSQLQRRRRLELDLAGAATRGELQLHYQPLVSLDADDAGIAGAEALLRWTHPALGTISPEEVVAIADGTGLIVTVGGWVVEEACRQLATWRAAGCLPDDFRMLVNISARQLFDEDLAAAFASACAAAGVGVGELVLEVTETAVLDEGGPALRTLRALKERGFGIALDDFGTGCSSLLHLKRVPLDLIKVDASFVRELPHSGDDQAIVAALVGIARQLGARVVGEGVETDAQQRILAELGCRYAQGRHLGRPVPPELLPLRGPARAAPVSSDARGR